MHTMELLLIKSQSQPEGKPIRLFMRQSVQVSLARHRNVFPLLVLSLWLIKLASLCHYQCIISLDEMLYETPDTWNILPHRRP